MCALVGSRLGFLRCRVVNVVVIIITTIGPVSFILAAMSALSVAVVILAAMSALSVAVVILAAMSASLSLLSAALLLCSFLFSAGAMRSFLAICVTLVGP